MTQKRGPLALGAVEQAVAADLVAAETSALNRGAGLAAPRPLNGKAFDERGLVIGTAAEGARLAAGPCAGEVPRRHSCHLGGETNACVLGSE
jgi:hypothetical protein